MQAFQGYFKNGRFIPQNNARIPEDKLAIVTVMDTPAPTEEMLRLQRWEAWRTFIRKIEEDDEDLPPEFEEILSHRFNISREIEL